MAEFKDRIKQLRQEKQLTQAELAAMAGVTKSAISMYERGERKPAFEAADQLAEVFNVSIAYLSGSSDDRGMYADPSALVRRLSPYESRLITLFRDATPEIKKAVGAILGADR